MYILKELLRSLGGRLSLVHRGERTGRLVIGSLDPGTVSPIDFFIVAVAPNPGIRNTYISASFMEIQ
ncbi:unnamed protein product [Boreogadus saida]